MSKEQDIQAFKDFVTNIEAGSGIANSYFELICSHMNLVIRNITDDFPPFVSIYTENKDVEARESRDYKIIADLKAKIEMQEAALRQMAEYDIRVLNARQSRIESEVKQLEKEKAEIEHKLMINIYDPKVVVIAEDLF